MYITEQTTIDEINRVIADYFSTNNTVSIVPVKVLMPSFIAAGIFARDHKNGAPIRSILKELDKTNRLHLIPCVFPERHDIDTYWYFKPADAPAPLKPYKQEEKKAESKNSRPVSSDKSYVIDLCDKVIGMKANRTKRFDFLLGDVHKDGVTQTKLPVDAFYPILQLVVHYSGMKPWEPAVKEFEKLEYDEEEMDGERVERKTKKIVSREEQRTIYEERRAKVFPKHDIDYVLISYSDFKHDEALKIIRNEAADLKIIYNALKEFISPEEDKN